MKRDKTRHTSNPYRSGDDALPPVLDADFRDRFPSLVEAKRIAVRKPNKQEFFRVHPDPEWSIELVLFNWEKHDEWHQVHPDLHASLRTDMKRVSLHCCINRADELFLWPIKIQNNSWSKSAFALAQEARESWIRIRADLPKHKYVLVAKRDGNYPLLPSMIACRRKEELLHTTFPSVGNFGAKIEKLRRNKKEAEMQSNRRSTLAELSRLQSDHKYFRKGINEVVGNLGRNKSEWRDSMMNPTGRRWICRRLKGPLPAELFFQAAKLPGKALAVYLILWHEGGCNYDNTTVKLSNTKWQMKMANISRDQKKNAIDHLERSGLIEVKRRRNASPMITMLPANKSSDNKNSKQTTYSMHNRKKEEEESS